MPDIRTILDPLPVDNAIKARAWDAFQVAKTEEEFQTRFDAIELPKETKAALWDAKFAPDKIEPGSIRGEVDAARRELGRYGLTAEPPKGPQFTMRAPRMGEANLKEMGIPRVDEAPVTNQNLQFLTPPPTPLTQAQAGAELDRIARRQPAMPPPPRPPAGQPGVADRLGMITPRPTPTMQDANAALAGTGLEVQPVAPPALPYVDDRPWLDKPPSGLDIRNAPKGSFLQRAYAGEIGQPQSAERVITAGGAATLEALSQLATPRNFAILVGLGAAHVAGVAFPPLAPAVGALDVGAAGYFSYEMVKGIVESAPEAKRALESGDYETAARIIGPAAVNAAMSYGLVTKVARPGFEAAMSVRRAGELYRSQQAHLERASRASSPFDRQAAAVAAESLGKEMGKLPIPSLLPPVPSPSGVSAYVKQQSEIGPATAIIPDRLFGLTPYQRKLIESLGPDLANQLPSRITEPQRPLPTVEAGLHQEMLTQAPTPVPAPQAAPSARRWFGSERGSISPSGLPPEPPRPPAFKQAQAPVPTRPEAGLEETLIPHILATHEQTGGSTYNLSRGENLAGRPFYSVAAHGELGTIIEGPLTPQALVAFLNKPGVREKLSDPSGKYSLGTWLERDTGKTYLDVVVTTPSRVEALEIGRNTTPDPQIAIFDLSKVDPKTGSVAEGAEISVPLGSTKLYHYSNRPDLERIDPSFYGRGQAGAEARRKLQAEPGQWVDRSYYTGEPKPPEARFGPGTRSPHLYETEVPAHRIYDLSKDPEGLISRAGGDITAAEALIRDAGYSGYRGSYGDGSPVYAVFKPLPAKSLSMRLQEAADNASARIQDRIKKAGTTLSANPAELPMTMVDLSIWGAAKMLKGTVDFAQWSAEMTKELRGRLPDIDLQKVYTQAQKTLARHVEATENQLPDLKRLMRLWRQGKAGKDWYEKANKEVHAIFGPEDAPVFLDMLAATSPDSSVKANLTFALNAFRDWKLGQEFSQNSYKYPAARNMLYKIIGGDQEWANPATAPKVYNFRRNLHGDPHAVTVDRWMAASMGFSAEGLTEARYKFIDYALTQAAKKAGVTPREFQAGLWTGMKVEATKALEKQGRSAGNTAEAGDYGTILRQLLTEDPELARMLQERGSWTKKKAEPAESAMPDWVMDEPSFAAPPATRQGGGIFGSERGAVSVGAVMDVARSLDREIIDRYSDIRRFTSAAKLPRDKDPYVGARLYSGRSGKIERRLKRGPDSLQNVIRPAYKKGHLKDMVKYGLFERFEELHGRGIDKFPNGKTIADIRAERTAFEAKMGPARMAEINNSLNQLRKFTTRMLTEARDGDLISDAGYNAILAKNQKYLPLQRLDYIHDHLDSMPIGSTLFSVGKQDVINRIHGSKREIADPLESIIRNVYKTVALVERNKVALQMADLSAHPAFAGKVIKLGAVHTKHGPRAAAPPSGYEKFSVLRKGRKEEYAAPAIVVQAMQGLTNKQTDVVTKMMTFSGHMLRQGATTLNAAFIPANAVRDFLTSHIVSEVGFSPLDWARGFAHAIRRGPVYDRYLESGAAFAGFFEQYKSMPAATRDLTGQVTLRKAIQVVNPLDWVRLIGEKLEMVPRLGSFARAERMGRSAADAAFVSRNATVDFAKAGSFVKVANLWIPFLNARLQGTLNMGGALGHHPVRAAAVITGLIGMPAFLTYLNNTYYHEDIWKDIAGYEKENNFILIYGDERDEEGNPTQVYKIPKGDAKVFANPLETFLDHLHGNDPKSFRRLAIQWLSDISPVEFAREGEASGMRVASSLMPVPGKVITEWATNKNLFTERDIVPQKGRLRTASATEQYTERTPKTVVSIAKLLGVSPMKLENAIGTQFGGLGRQLMPAADLLTFGETGARGPINQIFRRFHGARGGGAEEADIRRLEEASQGNADEYVRADRQAKALYKSILAAPRAEREKVFEQFVRTETERLNAAQDPAAKAAQERLMVGTVKLLANHAIAQAQGLTDYERLLRAEPVAVRAKVAVEKLRSLPPEERAQTFERWVSKKVLTKSVIRHIIAQAQAGGTD